MPLLQGVKTASTPEQLMRSRFSAFCEGDVRYLLETHHASTREPNSASDLSRSVSATRWLSLKVISSAQQGSTGHVEFVAFYTPTSAIGELNSTLQWQDVTQMHERSRFVLEDGRWFYVDGEFLADITLGRNDACWCGSGLKYKKCHAA